MVISIKEKSKKIYIAILLSLFILNNFKLQNEIKAISLDTENDINFNENLKKSDENGGGYEMNTNAPYSWIEIQSTGTHMSTISNEDDDYESISLISQGWSFTFYETSYDTLYVSSNGYMSFGNSYPGDTGGNIPDFSEDNKDTIALVWDDLNPSEGGDIYYQFFGTSPNRYLVIEYYQVVDYYDELQIGDCEVILYENGNIKFQYKSLNDHISPEIGLDHGDMTNFNRYDPTLPLNSKAIEFNFDEMDTISFTLNVNVGDEYSYIMNKFDDVGMELFFGNEWEQSFGLLPNPSRGYKTKIKVTSIETNSSFWKINYESWDWVYRKDQFGSSAIGSDYILHRRDPTEYVEVHNMTHYFPFFIPQPNDIYISFAKLSNFYYINDYYYDDLYIEYDEDKNVNGHDISLYGRIYYNENSVLRSIKLEYWNDTSNQVKVILDLELFSSEHLLDFQMNFSVDDEVSYFLKQLDNDKLEQIYGSSWEQSFGFLNNPMLYNKMKFSITSITQNDTHFEVDYNIWNWTERTEKFSQNNEDVGGMIYRRDPYNYTNPMKMPYIFPFFIPISLSYPYYAYLPEGYYSYLYEHYYYDEYCRIEYNDILMINSHEIEIDATAIYDENGFLTRYYLEYENNTSHEYGDIIELKRAIPRNFENFTIPVELHEEYNWLIVECNNMLMENALGSDWEADYGLPENPQVLDKTKIKITLNIEKNETHWQTNYDLWDWISHDDQFSQSASQSDTLEFRKNPLNYTSLNMLPNIFPLFLPYPVELYLEFARLEENYNDYWIDFDEETNCTEIEYGDNIGDIWIWANAEYNPTGILHRLYIYLENDTSYETICQFEMISYVEGPKPHYIGISEDEIYEYGVYYDPDNGPEDFYLPIDVNLDRIKLNIEMISGEDPSLNYCFIMFNMSQMISGTYSNVERKFINIYEDSMVDLYSSLYLLYGPLVNNFFCSKKENWNNIASFLNNLMDTVNITALSNGLKMTQLVDGKILEFFTLYNSNGVLETFELYYDGIEFLSIRLNDFGYGGGDSSRILLVSSRYFLIIILIIFACITGGIVVVLKMKSSGGKKVKFKKQKEKVSPVQKFTPIKAIEVEQIPSTVIFSEPKRIIQVGMMCSNCRNESYIKDTEIANYSCKRCSGKRFFIGYYCKRCDKVFAIPDKVFFNINLKYAVECKKCGKIMEILTFSYKPKKLEEPAEDLKYQNEEILKENTLQSLRPEQIKKPEPTPEYKVNSVTREEEMQLGVMCLKCTKEHFIPNYNITGFKCSECSSSFFKIKYQCNTCGLLDFISEELYLASGKMESFGCRFCNGQMSSLRKVRSLPTPMRNEIVKKKPEIPPLVAFSEPKTVIQVGVMCSNCQNKSYIKDTEIINYSCKKCSSKTFLVGYYCKNCDQVFAISNETFFNFNQKHAIDCSKCGKMMEILK